MSKAAKGAKFLALEDELVEVMIRWNRENADMRVVSALVQNLQQQELEDRDWWEVALTFA